jgi:hypothetical protein
VLDAVTDPGGHGVEVVLAPYQAVVLVGHDDLGGHADRGGHERVGGHDGVSVGAGPVSRAEEPTVERARLDDGWRLRGLDGTDLGEVLLPHRWEDDPRIGPDHSGTLAYETTVAVPTDAGPIRLDLGEGRPAQDSGAGRESGIEGHSYRVRLVPPVGEVVRVLVDDVPVATLWAPPYVCDLTEHLRDATTVTLRLEVSNTTANALAADQTVTGWVADAERWHGRRFRMQALDRVREGLSSGLLTVPELLSWRRSSP